MNGRGFFSLRTATVATGHGVVPDDGLTTEERQQAVERYREIYRPTAKDHHAFAEWLKRKRAA
ncbi:hypothetical protein [Humibacter soli]